MYAQHDIYEPPVCAAVSWHFLREISATMRMSVQMVIKLLLVSTCVCIQFVCVCVCVCVCSSEPHTLHN